MYMKSVFQSFLGTLINDETPFKKSLTYLQKFLGKLQVLYIIPVCILLFVCLLG